MLIASIYGISFITNNITTLHSEASTDSAKWIITLCVLPPSILQTLLNQTNANQSVSDGTCQTADISTCDVYCLQLSFLFRNDSLLTLTGDASSLISK